jgi:metal-responsive CopG/Arc/MetJ family transcriptional regulator
MAYRKPVAYSLPPPLAQRLERYAKRKQLTKSEVARAAFTRYLDDEEEREARWKRLRAVGAAAVKRAGIRSEEELQATLYEMRHGRPLPSSRSDGRRSSNRR